jgi:type IV secretion system protein VirD4
MVSRQETARPLLTAGEVMQLPATDELVLVSGVPPVRAKKARYFEDRRLADRVRPLPAQGSAAISSQKAGPSNDDWTSLPIPIRAVQEEPQAVDQDDSANAGIRREPALPEHEAIAVEDVHPAPDFAVIEDEPDLRAVRSATMQRRVQIVARQASMDPDDGVAL